MNLVSVILIKKVRFLDFTGHWVELDKHTEVILDINEGIAYHKEICFDIDKNEYSVLN